MPSRIGSLFSGYGGLDMAVAAVTGASLAWWSDTGDGPARIMSHHHPGVPNLGDIVSIDWDGVEPVDVLTGGFPCQDISAAGKRLGIRPGTRSGLWTHMAYAISRLQPRLVVIENVRALCSASAHSIVEPCPGCVGDDPAESALRALGAVLGDLAGVGFDAEVVGLPASAVGACHERWREFIVAWPEGRPWDGTIVADPGRFRGGQGQQPASGQETGREPLTASGERRGMGAGWGGYEQAIRRHERAFGLTAPAPTRPSKTGRPKLSPAFCEWMMGLRPGYITDPAIWAGMTGVHGRPAGPAAIRNEQIRAAGNGVVPLQAEAAIREGIRRSHQAWQGVA